MISGTHSTVDDSRNDQVKIYVNGDYLPRELAKISVFDSGFLVGDGVWEGLRLHKGKLVFLEDHLHRLWNGAKTIGLNLTWSKEELSALILDILAKNEMEDGVHVRVMVTRGIKKTPSQDPRLTISDPGLVIIPEYKQVNPKIKQKGISLFTSTIRRGSPDSLDPRLNCHSKIHEVMALNQALAAGADEALMLDPHGFVSTCNSTNFFIVEGDEIWTSTGSYCMQGITRAKVIALCKNNDIPIREKSFSLFDVYGASEAFVTGSFGGITPVSSIDAKSYSGIFPGKITRKIDALYQELVLNSV
jgi:branched-chain amino acid aminotransferase